jgi:outer membrane receptor protein involved in Fe transport
MKVSQRFVLFVAAFLLVAGSAFGQGTTGALNGTVTHEGAPLPGVTITISSPALQGTRVAVSNVNGDFNFPALPPGQYTVRFEMEGMATVTQSVRVGLARTDRANAVMQLSAIAEAITVTAAAPAVLETTEVQSNFQSDQIEDLPVARTIQATVQLAPGVTSNGPGGQAVVGGGYAYDTLYLINGAVTNENVRGQMDVGLFIEDAVQETTILMGSVSAEYGRFTGGVVSAITKSGGNEFSGSFRDSFDNPSWTAASDFGESKAASVTNETYEATLGGRIVRDRLWFFGAGRYVEQTFQGFFINSDEERPSTVQVDERFEVKLTGQINPKHSLVGSYLSFEVDQTPHCAFGCWDINTMDLDGRQIPREMMTANYNGILTSNFLVEAGYSTRDLIFQNSGGNHVTSDYTNPRDIALGSWAYDISYGGAWGAPIFCGVCDDEVRENEYYNLKGTYYLATPSLGTHNIVMGYENFAESRFANNYQGGSGLDIYVYSGIAPTRVGPASDPTSLRPVISYGDLILWTPIETLSQGSDFVTDSLFVNDKWDLNSKWSFNIGVRYDKNDGRDSSKNPISKDDNISPRLGVIYDINGDGRFRVNASYSRYVSRIQETIGGGAGGGNPSYYLYLYDGPDIGGPDSGLSSFDVLEQTIMWLMAQGWSTANPTLGGSFPFIGAGIPGFNQRLDGSLQSPAVDEFTIGFGMQVGQKGFLRFDYIDKDWADFYVGSTAPGDTVTGVPGTLDVVTIENCSNCLERTYQALQIQGNYRFTDRFSIGGNYTWSEAKGNTVGESFGSGPGWDDVLSYVEYNSYAQARPVGFLPNDQEHKARLWLAYDLPLGAFGNLNFSLLERFDSGTPYSAVGTINTAAYVACNPCGYATPDPTHSYFFSERGEYRWEDQTATDVAINYEIPISKVNLFVQGELLNAFNEQAVVAGSTSIRLLQAFNPFTETPVEGVHWAKAASFGNPTGPNSYQARRTYRFSVGLRF